MTINSKCLTIAMLYLVATTCSSDVNARSLQGKVTLIGKNTATAKVEDTIIYFEPNQKIPTKPFDQPHQIKMRKKAYHPRVSAVSIGSEIEISNQDTILHNAFSPSKPNDFDMGFFGKNDGKTHKVTRPGVVRIFCNVHFRMVAYVLALDTPFFTQPDNHGIYTLNNLPEGGGKLIFWHERTERVIKEISISSLDTINIELEVTKRRVPIHKKKSGASYKKKRRTRRKYNQ